MTTPHDPSAAPALAAHVVEMEAAIRAFLARWPPCTGPKKIARSPIEPSRRLAVHDQAAPPCTGRPTHFVHNYEDDADRVCATCASLLVIHGIEIHPLDLAPEVEALAALVEAPHG